MKASIKFRQDQKPLFRAKVPLNVLGLPFQSGVVAGESKELSLNLGTFFDSGPAVKFAYRPNDSLNPFSIVFKTGIGHFGSPISSPMVMSAELNLVGDKNRQPSFFLHFKPRFGDFCLKKSQSSNFVKGIKSKMNREAHSEEERSTEMIETPPAVNSSYLTDNGLSAGKKIGALPSEWSPASLVAGLLSGTEASAKTALPLMNRAVLNFRWGFRFPAAEEPAGLRRNEAAGISFEKFPVLVMNKIGIEHVTNEDSEEGSAKEVPISNSLGSNSVVEMCLAVKNQLEVVKAENEMLRKAMDELRSEFVAGKPPLSAGEKKSTELNGLSGKATEGNLKEELKKH
ncbi:unnamed protein product [Thlaspi arvense]|uniref:Uncharacterized protein n=1 Tax=Thlaspi arvense TaxID=13288 RepID=A0AAU9RHP1_THLAR|nr:unnamed protein product [Thlaspi arvense]